MAGFYSFIDCDSSLPKPFFNILKSQFRCFWYFQGFLLYVFMHICGAFLLFFPHTLKSTSCNTAAFKLPQKGYIHCLCCSYFSTFFGILFSTFGFWCFKLHNVSLSDEDKEMKNMLFSIKLPPKDFFDVVLRLVHNFFINLTCFVHNPFPTISVANL